MISSHGRLADHLCQPFRPSTTPGQAQGTDAFENQLYLYPNCGTFVKEGGVYGEDRIYPSPRGT